MNRRLEKPQILSTKFQQNKTQKIRLNWDLVLGIWDLQVGSNLR